MLKQITKFCVSRGRGQVRSTPPDSTFRGGDIKSYSFRRTSHSLGYKRIILVILECIILRQNVAVSQGHSCSSVQTVISIFCDILTSTNRRKNNTQKLWGILPCSHSSCYIFVYLNNCFRSGPFIALTHIWKVQNFFQLCTNQPEIIKAFNCY